MSSPLVHEKVWADKYKYEEAEKQYFERLAKLLSNNGISYPPKPTSLTTNNSIPTSVKTGVVNKAPEYSPLPSPSSTSVAAPMDAEQDKKKKRRKRNNASNASAVLPSNVAVNNTVIQEVVSVEMGTDKKVKEKKNEASKKGKKQSPEPKGTPANPPPPSADDKSSLASEVARARQHIKSSLECVDRISSFSSNAANGADVINRILSLEKENETLRKLVETMQKSQDTFENRLIQLEKKCSSVTGASAPAQVKPVAKPAAKVEDDDDVDLFGSDSEDEDDAAKKVREQRLAEYAAKKSKKPVLIAKSNVILDVKPWDDETDMKQLEQAVRTIEMEGLLWGASKLVPLAYGIHKLQISCVVEDEKVSIDLLTESIEEKSDFVQSVDIAAFNKI